MNKKPILPPRRRSNPIVVQPLNSNRKRIWSDYARLMTWRAVGAEYGVSAGAVYRLAVSNKEPHDNAIRAAIGLPITAPAPVCGKCGVVHLAKRCPKRDRFAENAAEYDAWRAAHAAEIAGIVAWAEGKESC